MGFMLTPASTDAVNRASRLVLRGSHGHHPDGPQLRGQPGSGHPWHGAGLTNCGRRVTSSLIAKGVRCRTGDDSRRPTNRASPRARAAARRPSRTSFASTSPTPSRTVFYIMAGDHGRRGGDRV